MASVCGKFLAGAGFAIALVAGTAVPFDKAQAVTIENGSFEDASVNPGGSFVTLNGPNNTSITGWTINGSIDYIGGYWQAANGTRSLDMNGTGIGGTISQTLHGLSVGQEYTVSFSLAGNTDSGPNPKVLGVTAAAGQNSYNFNISGQSHGAMGWISLSFVFIAQHTDEVLSFASLTSGSFGPALDNVSITATPLPPAAILFIAGLGGMGLLAARRRKGEARLPMISNVAA